MLTQRPKRLLAAILVACMLGAAWSSGLETIELDGYRATFDPNQAFTVTEGEVDCTPFGGPATVRVTETLGRLGEADYLVYQPEDWNGDLVLWAHAFLPTLYPAGAFPFPVPVGFGPYPAESDSFFRTFLYPRDAIICHGFAMAASAFERHGLAVQEGMHDTHLLNQIAPRHLGAEPEATYLTGYSGGGLITIALVERFPHRYAGALTDQGTTSMSVAGYTFSHIRAVLDVYFPGLIDTPLFQGRDLTPDEFGALVAALMARVQADPAALQRMARVRVPGSERLDPAGRGAPLLLTDPFAPDPAAAFESLVTSMLPSLQLTLMFVQDMRERLQGGVPFDNRHTVYTGFDLSAEEEADLNARVPRYDADDWAVRYFTFFYEPSGELQLPLVSIRVSHNPMVPIQLGWAYDQAVARAGATDLHSVWLIERYGHNTLTAQEFATALLALTEWVETGTRPIWPTMP
jgi:hypothetical protein